MAAIFRYRGREVTDDDAMFIRELIADNPGLSRRALSAKLCEAWNWRQANGALRDMVCRSLLLELHRAGLITLPPVRRVNANPLARRLRPPPVSIDESPVAGSLSEVLPLSFLQVRRTGAERLFNGLIEHHHYS